MEENLSTNNVADAAQIADLSARTEVSFMQYSRVFLWWGIIALVECVPLSFYSYIRQMDNSLNRQNNERIISLIENNQFMTLLIVIGFPLMLAGWYLAYYAISRTVNPRGKSKELMKLWVWSVVATLLPIISAIVSVIYANVMQAIFLHPFAPSLSLITLISLHQFLWFVFSFMMMLTGMLTRSNTYKWFALLLALIGIIVPSGIFAYPVTFLLLGGYLEWKRGQNTMQEHGAI